MAVWVLAAGWGQPPQGCMFCLMHWVRRYLGIHRMHYSLKKLQEESGSRRTLQHTLDMPFISVSLCLRFDLEMCGSRAIWSTMSSDLSFYFSCSFLSSPELGTQLLKAGRTLMFSLKLRLAQNLLWLLSFFSFFLCRERGKSYPFPMVLLSCMFCLFGIHWEIRVPLTLVLWMCSRIVTKKAHLILSSC